MQYKIGDWLVIASENTIINQQQKKTIEPKVMALLIYFCQRPGQVISTDELLENVWQNRVVTGSSIYQTIAQLRKALADKASNPRYISTVPKKGYKLIAQVKKYVDGTAQAANKERAGITQGPTEASKGQYISNSAMFHGRKIQLMAITFVVLLLIIIQSFYRTSKMAQASTIAILPFTNNTESEGQRSLAEASAWDLSNLLNRSTNLRIVSHTSSAALAKKDLSAIEIADALTADYLIEGQVDSLPSGNYHLEISLIRGKDGIQIWSGGSDLSWQQLEQTQLVLLKEMLAQLKNEQIIVKNTDELYLKAQQVWRNYTPETTAQAIDILSIVTSIDDQDSRAFAALSALYLEKYSGENDNPIWLKLSKKHLYRSLSLTPESADSLMALANVQLQADDYAEARRSAETVLKNDQKNLAAHLMVIKSYLAEYQINHAKRALLEAQQQVGKSNRLAFLKAIIGLQSGQLKKNIKLIDALLHEPMPYYYSALAIATATTVGQSEMAYHWGKTRLEITPNQHHIWVYQSINLANLGQFDEARAALTKLNERPISQTFSAYEAVYLAQNQQNQLLALVKDNQLKHSEQKETPTTLAIYGISAMYAGNYKLAINKLRSALQTVNRSYDQLALSSAFYYGSLAYSLEQENRPIEAAQIRQQGLAQISEYNNNGVKLSHLNVYRARLYSLNDHNMALRSLKKAVGNGYSKATLLKHDVVLTSLHENEEFTALIAQAELNKHH
ncbi:winged helix-turn-helix domain-containing protein [Motilimonas cestriensis]|uniref:Winged helix-turn-helix domain-containing protein n=1 Tax=Motilimonas cestriensis TaxID=2742685 RepID=A0ABS8WHX1_9GAMM|nr:winged helix-turn-helix domain-containing protein [Motilimonas cestriensis]MCE2597229.1 winged helix-turn-helix domain-containing protein [Motilimonas cestriensis]